MAEGINYSAEPHGDGVTMDPRASGGSDERFATTALAPEFRRTEQAVHALRSELKGLFSDLTQGAKKMAAAAKEATGGSFGSGRSYTQQFMQFGHRSAAGALDRWRGMYTDRDPATGKLIPGNIDEAARVQVGLQTGMVVGQLGGGLNRFFGAATSNASVLDWAATQRAQLYGGMYSNGTRRNFNQWASGYGNVQGWQNLEDLSRGVLANNVMGGQRGRLTQIGNLAALNPTMGIGGAAQAYQSMLSPQALQSALPWGGLVRNRVGGERHADDMMARAALIASGEQRFGRGGLTQRQARATFAYGSQGYQNLKLLGVPDEMIPSIMQYASQSAAAGRQLDLDNPNDRRHFGGAYLSNVNKLNQRRGQRDVSLFEGSRDTQMTFNDAVGRFDTAVGDFVKATHTASALFGAGKLGGIVGSLGQTGLLGLLLQNGIPGGGGVVGGLGAAARGGGLSSILGGGSGFSGALGVGLGALGAGVGGYAAGSVVDHFIPKHSAWQRGLGGAARWGGAGAGVGAVLGGPLGAAIGGGIGAVGGGLLGAFGIGDPDDGGLGPLPPGPSEGPFNPALDKALRRMFAENPKLQISSGRRSTESQRSLFLARYVPDPKGSVQYAGKRWSKRPGQPVTAPPGRSKHEKGLAVDIGPASEYGWLAANAARFGLKRTVKSEPWHFEPSSAEPDSSPSGGGTITEVETSGGFRPGAVARGGLDGGGWNLGGRSSASSVEFGSGTSDMGTSGSGGGGGGSLSNTSLVSILKAAGFEGEGLRKAYAIAMAESGGRADARGVNKDSRHTVDRGLFQINSYWHREVTDAQAYNAVEAAKAAFRISGGGTNWSQWSTMGGDRYKKYYGEAAGIGDPASGGSVGGGSVSMARTVNIGNIHLVVKTETVSHSEAERLVGLMKDVIANDQQLERLGSS